MIGTPTGVVYPRDVPVLTDDVVTLRAHRMDDVDAIVQMGADPTMQRWTAIPENYTRENAVAFARDVMRRGWEEMNHRGWAIEARDPDAADGTPRFAGNLDVRGTPVADIGFALHPWARRRGLMTRAIGLAVQWAFQHGGVEIVHWRSHVGNIASLRTAWASGFELHGTTPGLLYERGRVLDAWTGSLRFGTDGRPGTTWWDTPVIEGERVRLRPYDLNRDLPAIVQTCGDDETRRWLAHLPSPYTVQAARDYVYDQVWQQAAGTGAGWCVADRETDRMLAAIAVMHISDESGSGEIGYWAHPDARGRGAVTEATRLVVAQAVKPRAERGLGRRRLELFAAAGNAPSKAIARAAGFTHVGTRRDAEPLGNGEFDDLLAYDLLA